MRTESDDDPPTNVRRWLISCDESGVHGARFYGFGSLWMAWQRRGDFARLIDGLRDRFEYRSEIKWTRVKRLSVPFYLALVDEFFRAPWMQFHCVLVEKSVVKKGLHKGSFDMARRKHFTMLLTNKIRRALRAHPERQQTFRVWLDPFSSSYEKVDEVVEIVSNHVLKAVGQDTCVDGVFTHRSHEKPSIQVSDLLLGAVWSAFEQSAEADAKLKVQQSIAGHLGWPDLRADTKPKERKFNVWVFYDRSRGRRTCDTRRVTLK
jgi:hypothetical protein